MSTQPTDAEILELASQYWYSLDETESETEIELVRAALAKWGRSLQQEVQKPVAWQHQKPIVDNHGQLLGYSEWKDGGGLSFWPHRKLFIHQFSDSDLLV